MFTTLLAPLVLAQATASDVHVNVRVDGEGYLRFARQGEVVYAKKAQLTIKDGKLCAKEGPWVLPAILVKGQPDELEVDLEGKVTALYGDQELKLGQLVLASLPDDIRPVESRGFLVAMGKPKLGEPGSGLFGVIRAGEEEMKSESVKIVAPQKVDGGNRVKVYMPGKEPGAKPEIDAGKSIDVSQFAPSIEFLREGGVRVVLTDEVRLDSDVIRLGEVATVFVAGEKAPEALSLSLGSTPNFGVARTLDEYVIKAMLRRAGFAPTKIEVVGARRCKVYRKGQTIKAEQFVDVAKVAAQERYGILEAELTKPIIDLEAPKGELTLIADNVRQSGNGVNVTVIAYVDGKRINSRTVLMANPAVPVNLKVGDVVPVWVLSGAASVEAKGKIRKIDGVTGEVTVLIESTKAILTGKVNKQGVVEVKA